MCTVRKENERNKQHVDVEVDAGFLISSVKSHRFHSDLTSLFFTSRDVKSFTQSAKQISDNLL